MDKFTILSFEFMLLSIALLLNVINVCKLSKRISELEDNDFDIRELIYAVKYEAMTKIDKLEVELNSVKSSSKKNVKKKVSDK